MRGCRFSTIFQCTVKETDASKLCGSMNEELPEIITQRKMGVYSKQFEASRYKEKETPCLRRKRSTR